MKKAVLETLCGTKLAGEYGAAELPPLLDKATV